MQSDLTRVNHAMATEREASTNVTTLDPAWQRFAAHIRARNAEVSRQTEAEAVRSRAAAEAIAAMLRERFGAMRVILFGSLARGRFRLDSDIDLAVAGLAKGDLFRAMADAMEFTNRWVDIKPLEEVDPHFRLRILETGIDL